MPKAGKRRPVESTTGLLLNMRTSGNHADMSRALHDKLDQILLGTTASQIGPFVDHKSNLPGKIGPSGS